MKLIRVFSLRFGKRTIVCEQRNVLNVVLVCSHFNMPREIVVMIGNLVYEPVVDLVVRICKDESCIGCGYLMRKEDDRIPEFDTNTLCVWLPPYHADDRIIRTIASKACNGDDNSIRSLSVDLFMHVFTVMFNNHENAMKTKVSLEAFTLVAKYMRLN